MSETGVYRSEQLSRRGEAFAWLLTFMAAFYHYTVTRNGPAPAAVWALTGSVLFAALLISLTNWSDRHKRIQLDEQGVFFTNGLQSVRLGWDEIIGAAIYPGNGAYYVRVTSGKHGFLYRIPREGSIIDRTIGQAGFLQGREILDEIIRRSRLEKSETRGQTRYHLRK